MFAHLGHFPAGFRHGTLTPEQLRLSMARYWKWRTISITIAGIVTGSDASQFDISHTATLSPEIGYDAERMGQRICPAYPYAVPYWRTSYTVGSISGPGYELYELQVEPYVSDILMREQALIPCIKLDFVDLYPGNVVSFTAAENAAMLGIDGLPIVGTMECTIEDGEPFTLTAHGTAGTISGATMSIAVASEIAAEF